MLAKFFPTGESVLLCQDELNLVHSNGLIDREIEPHGFNRGQLALEQMLEQVFGLLPKLFEGRGVGQLLQREWSLGIQRPVYRKCLAQGNANLEFGDDPRGPMANRGADG